MRISRRSRSLRVYYFFFRRGNHRCEFLQFAELHLSSVEVWSKRVGILVFCRESAFYVSRAPCSIVWISKFVRCEQRHPRKECYDRSSSADVRVEFLPLARVEFRKTNTHNWIRVAVRSWFVGNYVYRSTWNEISLSREVTYVKKVYKNFIFS